MSSHPCGAFWNQSVATYIWRLALLYRRKEHLYWLTLELRLIETLIVVIMVASIDAGSLFGGTKSSSFIYIFLIEVYPVTGEIDRLNNMCPAENFEPKFHLLGRRALLHLGFVCSCKGR